MRNRSVLSSPAAKENTAHMIKLLQTASEFPASLDSIETRRCCIQMLLLINQKAAFDAISTHVLSQPVILNLDAHIVAAKFIARTAEVAAHGKGLASAGARVFDDSMVRAMRAVALDPSVVSQRRRSAGIEQLLGSVGQYFHHYIVNWVRTHDSGKNVPDYSVIVNPFLCIYSNCRRNAALSYCLYRDYTPKKRSLLEGLLSSVHRWLLEVNSGHTRKRVHEGSQPPPKMDFDADDAYEAVVSRASLLARILAPVCMFVVSYQSSHFCQVWALRCVHMAREHCLKERNISPADVHTFQLSGAAGTSAVYVNGEYVTTDDEANGRPLYRKRDDSDILIEYWAPLEEWQVTSTVVELNRDFGI